MTFFISSDCEDSDGPEQNSRPNGVYNGSPEDSIVQIIINEYIEEYKVDVRIAFFEGNALELVKFLEESLAKHSHLDYIAVSSIKLDTLIATNWIKPYPGDIDEENFYPDALESLRRGNLLYGVPLYIVLKTGRVKGICISTKVQDDLENIIIELIEYISKYENAKRIADAAGATPARTDSL